MKKLLILLTLLITLTGCSRQAVLKDPPTLTVRCGEQTARTGAGSFSWDYKNPDGSLSSAIGDGVHPLDAKDHVSTLETDAATATLEFGVEPKTLSVKCWRDTHWGDTTAASSVPNLEGNELSLRSGGFIYQIHASWEGTGYSGSGSYVVYIISTAEEPILTAPPTLTVQSGDRTVTAKLGTYSWSHRTGEGTVASEEACSSHPLMLLTNEDRLETRETYTYLHFEVPPDRMESFCWYDTALGTDSDLTGNPIDDYWAGYRINPANGGLIFRIKAYWDDREGYEGTAEYCFYLDKKAA